MAYALSRTPPSDYAALLAWLNDELARVARESNEPSVSGVVFKTLNVVPPRLREGLTVLADGANWNPGAGQGIYTYYAGAWHKLG